MSLSSGPGGVKVAGTYRSARMTGEPAAAAGLKEEEYPGGDSQVRHLSLPALPSQESISDSTSPTTKRGYSVGQPRNCFGPASMKPRVWSYWSS